MSFASMLGKAFGLDKKIGQVSPAPQPGGGNALNNFGHTMMGRLEDKWNSGMGGAMLGHMWHPQDQQQNFGQPAPVADQMGLGPGFSIDDSMTGTPAAADATRQQEAMARQHGFRDYGQMLDWARQRAAPHTGSIAGRGQQGSPGGPVNIPSPGGAMDWHPRNMFNYLADMVRGATGQR